MKVDLFFTSIVRKNAIIIYLFASISDLKYKKEKSTMNLTICGTKRKCGRIVVIPVVRKRPQVQIPG